MSARRWCAALVQVALCGASLAHAQDAPPPVHRIEFEQKLDVPAGIADAVWDYLRERYPSGGPSPVLARFPGHFTTAFSVETFQDEYFDTPDRALLARKAGVRHRKRWIPENTSDAKHGRELIHIKLSGIDDDPLHRAEMKFEPRLAAHPSGRERRPLLDRLDGNAERRAFESACGDMGVAATRLLPTLVNYQVRRRIYIALDGSAFATLSLDEVVARQGWFEASFHEIEIEISELRYTHAGPAERATMARINATMAFDLRERFPAITQDQTPKYNKSQQRLDSSTTAKLAPPPEVGWMAAAVLVFGSLYWRGRRRRLSGRQ